MTSLRALAAWAAGLVLCALPARGVELSGRVVLTEKGRATTDPTVDLRRAVVWFEPEVRAEPKDEAAKPPVFEMSTVRKQFLPQVLVVPVGATVRFPNQDPILHNVFSVSGGNAFDLGLVGSGKGKEATFHEAGVVRVFCNVHHAMFSHIVVVATPYHVQAGADGGFRLEHLPAGRGTLKVWHERGDLQARALTLPAGGPVELHVEITQPRVPPHKNKFGKSYTGGGYG